MPEIELACGEGLAEQSELPRSVARLIAATAGVLELHMTALDPRDGSTAREHAAYEALSAALRANASDLRSTAEQMQRYHDLPPAKHDAELLRSPRAADAFASFVKAQDELFELLRKRVGQDRALLDEMRS
jgi:hypothetical protein